jgi:Leucine-rich repeat (LRR) protein
MGQLASLKKLDLSFNSIHDLPTEMGALNLREISVESNPLTERLKVIASKGTAELLKHLKGNVLHVKPGTIFILETCIGDYTV